MSKSILVIDTPKSCDYCPLGRIFGMAGSVECRAKEDINDIKVNRDGTIIPDWCPLKELPEKEKHSDCFDEYEDGFAYGWNSLLENINQ